ncbi:MAG TPA: hypothetical protein VGM77_08010 [Gemmatimonadales bacterium]|jgi:hypothetical protein
MTGTWIALALIVALLIWLMGIGRRAPIAPDDDVDSPIDHDELAEAERAIRDDPTAKAAADAVDDDEDDWGPGSGHSPMPGIF